MKKLEKQLFVCFRTSLFLALLVIFSFSFSNAQSTNQNNPTPVTSNEISGTIPARAIGDSRLTNYFYTFNGNQGDVFINLVTKNLDGDIDIFTVDGLKPLTKITIFSDNSDNETGRIVYLRKFEKLLLRIQGRSPNDDPATFVIKFAGSFQRSQSVAETEETKLPEINTTNQGEVRVNSVGTIIEPIRKPTPEPNEVAEIEKEAKKSETEPENIINKEINVKSVDSATVSENSTKIEIKRGKSVDETNVVEPKTDENVEENPKVSKPVLIITEDSISDEKQAITEEPKEIIEKSEVINKVEKNENENESVSKTVRPLKSEQLAKIELVVRFKDGKTIKLSMNNVFSFNVNQGILTIILYDGKVSRYSLLDIEKISIEGNENQ